MMERMFRLVTIALTNIKADIVPEFLNCSIFLRKYMFHLAPEIVVHPLSFTMVVAAIFGYVIHCSRTVLFVALNLRHCHLDTKQS